MTNVAVRELLYLLEEAYSAMPLRGDEGSSQSLLGNLVHVDKETWARVPAGGRRSIRDIVLHVGSCLHMYRNHAFESGGLRWDSPITWPWPDGNAPMPETLDWLREAHELFRAAVQRLTDEDLEAPPRAPWGELRPTRWLVKVMIEHYLYHSGEINHIRSILQGTDGWAFEEDVPRSGPNG